MTASFEPEATSPSAVAPAAALNPPRVHLRAAGGIVIAVSIGLSACLLFTLELMVGLLLLPLLGGAPSVWATTLGFFQLILLLGYLYAHLSATRLGRLGPVFHLILAVAALASVAFGPKMTDLHYETLHPVLQVLATLAVGVGLPAFVLCATTPLLSAWLADALAAQGAAASAPPTGAGRPADGASKDPYRLYVVSNAGSLIALLAYPIAIEPFLGLGSQRVTWGLFFGLMVALLAMAGLWRASISGPGHIAAAHDAPADREHLAGRRVARWILLAAIPCGLLSAVTNFITADLVSAPLLWVGPLAIYLATFIVAFSARGKRPVAVATAVAPAMATMMWVPFGFSALWPTLALLLLELIGFAAIALTLHGALAADRPGPSRLTLFYLVVSAGGVVGGAFVGFVAPVIFPGIWEYPILLVAALAAMPALGQVRQGLQQAGEAAMAVKRRGLNLRPFVAGGRTRLSPFLVVGIACATPIAIFRPAALVAVVPFMAMGALLLLLGAKPAMLATTTAVVLIVLVAASPNAPIYRERDFFGVTEVTRDDVSTTIWHGTTPHGSQWTDPARSREPRGYYDVRGPLGDAMDLAQARGAQQIGIIGLGAGGIAAYQRPIDRITFFEIDPAVVRVAEDTLLFTYLSQAPNRPTVVLGDGRLELRKIPDASYDLLILDAFSGDSIPTHLLTVEALREDLRVLKPGGLLVVHVSNRYYDLAPAVVAGASQAGMTATMRRWDPTEAQLDEGAKASQWVVATTRPAEIASLAGRGWSSMPGASQAITDDYPDVMRFALFASWLSQK